MRNRFYSFFSQVRKADNKQLGQMSGLLIGIPAGIHAAVSMESASYALIGTAGGFSSCFDKPIATALIAGTYSNYFANFGAGIDILTNKKNIFDLTTSLYAACMCQCPGFQLTKNIKDFTNRIANSNNQELGWLAGTLLGLYVSFYGLPAISMTNALPITGSTVAFPIQFIRSIAVPYITGNFSNLFANLGAGLDGFTNKANVIFGPIRYLYTLCKSEEAKSEINSAASLGSIMQEAKIDMSTATVTNTSLSSGSLFSECRSPQRDVHVVRFHLPEDKSFR